MTTAQLLPSAATTRLPGWQRRLRERYGRWAVVTGASDGIGREIAVALAEAGLDLVLVARRRPLLERIAVELSRAHGIQARALPLDLAVPADIAALVDATRELDVGLYVAAAGFGTSGVFVGGGVEPQLQMIDVNCRAVVALTHAFGARFARRRRGGLVLLSSLVAFQGVPRAANYAATKAFIQTLAEGLRVELRPAGVDVVASAPGPVHSGFAARAAMTMTTALGARTVARATLRGLRRGGTVRPGWLSKVLELALAWLPRAGRVRMMGVVMSGMTRRPALPVPPEAT